MNSPSSHIEIEQLTRDFVAHVQEITRAQLVRQLTDGFGLTVAVRKMAVTAPAPALDKVRRKLPPQFCPVPRCKGKPAPIFGMVCSKHKDVPKAEIQKYRDARRAKKEAKKGKAA